MSNYILKNDDCDKNIIKISVTKGYSFNPKTKTKKYINAKKVTMYDEDKIAKILEKKYMVKYAKLVKIVQSIVSSDDSTDGDFMLVLDEVAKLKEVLYNRYKFFLKAEAFNEYFEQLTGIENYLSGIYIQKELMSGYRGGR